MCKVQYSLQSRNINKWNPRNCWKCLSMWTTVKTKAVGNSSLSVMHAIPSFHPYFRRRSLRCSIGFFETARVDRAVPSSSHSYWAAPFFFRVRHLEQLARFASINRGAYLFSVLAGSRSIRAADMRRITGRYKLLARSATDWIFSGN